MTKTTEVVVYVPGEATLIEAAEQSRGLKIAGVDDRKGYALVHEKRMELKGYRVEIEKTRKDLKADALEWGRKVDSEAKRLTALIEPTERELEAEETRIDAEKARIAAEEEAARRAQLDGRMAALHAVGATNVFPSAVQDMGGDEFAALLDDATQAHAQRQEAARLAAEEKARSEAEEAAARQAEREKLAAERAEIERAKEAARVEAERARDAERAEQARLQKIESERLAVERAAFEKEREAQRAEAEKLNRERAAAEAASRAEFDRLTTERRAFEAEQVRAAQERALEQARKEATEAARIEAEAAASRARVEAEERKRREAEEAARLEKLRPDIERVRTFAESLAALEIPDVWCTSAIRGALTYARGQILALAEIDP